MYNNRKHVNKILDTNGLIPVGLIFQLGYSALLFSILQNSTMIPKCGLGKYTGKFPASST